MLELIKQAASTFKYDKLTVIVAYASKLGCNVLVESLKDVTQNWDNIDKKWIISLDFGHTQPDALEYLSQLPKSEVFVPNAQLVLKSKLRPPIRFHPKLYYFQRSSNPNKVAIVSGSCNLTYGGLYLNIEQAIMTLFQATHTKSNPQDVTNLTLVQSTIQDIYSFSSPLTKQLLKKYRALWKPSYLPSTERKSPNSFIATNPSVDMPKALALSAASYFWIRVTPKVVQNLGPGKPGNQIDMQRGSRVYFGSSNSNVAPNTGLGHVSIRFKGLKSRQSLRYGNNGMDKITLPVLQYPRTYANRILLFHRNPSGYFDLKIGTPKKIAQYRQLSIDQHTLYKMQSGREYGVFS